MQWRVLGIWIGSFLTLTCGSPSPWASLAPIRNKMTEKELKRLGSGQGEFKPFSFALLADPQVFPGYLHKVVRTLNKRDDIEFSIILGDLTDRSLRREFEWVVEAIEKAKKPVLTVVGNHDGLLQGEEIYKQMFGALNYGFTYNGIRFVLWNNNPYEWGYPDFEWLQKEIHSHSHSVIASHQAPGRIERYPEANQRFRDLLAGDKVLGSFHGHTHKFYLQKEGDKPIFTVARVSQVQYAIARIDEDYKVQISQCEGSHCKEVH